MSFSFIIGYYFWHVSWVSFRAKGSFVVVSLNSSYNEVRLRKLAHSHIPTPKLSNCRLRRTQVYHKDHILGFVGTRIGKKLACLPCKKEARMSFKRQVVFQTDRETLFVMFLLERLPVVGDDLKEVLHVHGEIVDQTGMLVQGLLHAHDDGFSFFFLFGEFGI